MRSLIRDLISWGLLIGGLSASLTVTWWLLRPDVFTVVRHDAPTYRRLNDHVVPETRFHRGETMLILREWCISRLTDYIHERRFIDGLVYTLPITSRISNAPGCYRRYVGIEIPEQLPLGAYRYEATLTYEVSPLRRQIVTLPVAEITVIP